MIGDKEGDTKVDGGAKADGGVTDGGGVGSSPTAGAGTGKENDLEDQVSSPRTDVGKGLMDLTPPKSVSGKGKEEVGEGRVSYSSALVEGSSMADINLEFVVEDGVAEVEIPGELFEGVDPLWRCFVVGYFMNDAPHIGPIHATVNRIWNSPGKRSKIDVQFIGKTTVLFRIEDAATRNRILNRKFWHISEVPLMLGEWTPETACSPPDLSAMPLWVDLLNVPGYLYSKKGLSFLARTSGKFIKLHPNTERCIRMDVARVLVEVDLTKPLPNKISFKNREGVPALVSISYPWLPPRCPACSRWGHRETDCQAQNQTELSPPGNEANRVVNDSVIMEGSSLNEQTGRASKEIVTNLIAELKSLSEKENLSGGRVSVSQGVTIDCEEKVDCTDQEKWALVTSNSGMTSPAREVESCHSPNGFQILQDLQEEGEIADDDDSQSDTAEETVDEALEKNPKTDDVVGLTVKTLPPTNGGSKATTQRQNPVSRGQGRGSKRHKVKARDLVLVAAQQQKGQQPSKKVSSRKL